MKDDVEYRPSWVNRRRTIFGSLYFSAAVEVALIVAAYIGIESSPMLVTIAAGNRLMATAVIGSYVFGATWEDIRLWQR